MKTIGMIGGMSWESTADYYRLINIGIKEKLDGLHSAKIVMMSVDFQEIEALQHRGEWKKSGELLSKCAQQVEAGGADFLIICTNTMHIVAEQVQKAISIPLLHIADATGEELQNSNIKTVGLIGTQFTMEEDFYKKRLEDRFGLDVMIPEKNDRNIVHDVIYSELCLGNINAASRDEYIRIINELKKSGCEGVILGCTEIGMLLNRADIPLPIFDTTHIHARAAVNFSLKK